MINDNDSNNIDPDISFLVNRICSSTNTDRNIALISDNDNHNHSNTTMNAFADPVDETYNADNHINHGLNVFNTAPSQSHSASPRPSQFQTDPSSDRAQTGSISFSSNLSLSSSDSTIKSNSTISTDLFYRLVPKQEKCNRILVWK